MILSFDSVDAYYYFFFRSRVLLLLNVGIELPGGEERGPEGYRLKQKRTYTLLVTRLLLHCKH